MRACILLMSNGLRTIPDAPILTTPGISTFSRSAVSSLRLPSARMSKLRGFPAGTIAVISRSAGIKALISASPRCPSAATIMSALGSSAISAKGTSASASMLV